MKVIIVEDKSSNFDETIEDLKGANPSKYKKLTSGSLNDAIRIFQENDLGILEVNLDASEIESVQKAEENLGQYQQELKVQNEELRLKQYENEELRIKYQNFYDFSPVGLTIIDQNNIIHSANLYVSDLLKLDIAKLVGRFMISFIHYDDKSRFLTHLENVRLNNHDKIRLRVKNNYNDIKYIDLISKKIAQTSIQMALVDVSESVKTKQDLTDKERILTSTFNSINDTLIVIDKDRNVVLSNLKTLNNEELKDIPCYKAIFDEDTICKECHLDEVFSTGRFMTREVINPNTKQIYEVNVSPIRNEDGSIRRVVEHIRDVTKTRADQIEIENNQKILKITGNIKNMIISSKPINEIIDQALVELHFIFSDYRVAYSTISKSGTIFVNKSIQHKNMPDITGVSADLNSAPKYLEKLINNKPVIINDISTNELIKPIKDVLLSGGSKALIDIPIVHEESVIAMLCFDSPYAHQWQNTEIEALNQVANTISIAIRELDLYKKMTESEEQYRQLFNNANDAIFVHGINDDGTLTNLIDVNQTAIKRYGYSKEEFLSNSVSFISDEDSARKFPKIIEQLKLHRKVIFETKHKDKQNKIFPVEVSAHAFIFRNTRIIMSISRDITKRKEDEKKLLESEERFRSLVSTSEDMIFSVDKEYRYTGFFGKWFEKHNIETDNLIGKTIVDLVGENKAIPHIHAYNKIIKEGEDSYSYQWTLDFNNKKNHFHAILSAMKDEKGELVAIVGIGRDISEIKETQNKLTKYMKELRRSNAELQQFAYVASHDLQEPLRMVSSMVELLAKRYKNQLDEKADQIINFTIEGSNRMKQLIEDLLTYSRVNTKGKKFNICQPSEILKEVIKHLTHKIEETGANIIINNLHNIYADESQIYQLFLNLLQNSIKFKGNAEPEIIISSEKKQGYIIFSVQDNGIGIEPEFHDRIFQIFQRLHTRQEYEGTGIGLSVCKRVVERHKGEIWVESKPGKGSIFYFSIPCKESNNE